MKLEDRTLRVLFELLLGDIEVEPDPEIEAAWLEVAMRRLEDVENSNVEWIPAEVVFARARKMARKPAPPRPNIRVGGIELTTSQLIDTCLSLPVDERVALAGRYLARLRAASEVGAETRWLAESESWVSQARTALKKTQEQPGK